MTARLTYNEDKHYILLEFEKMDDWGVFHNGMRQLYQQVEQLGIAVDAVIVQKAPPPPGNPVSHFRSALTRQPNNLRGVVVVNTKSSSFTIAFLQQLIGVFARLFPDKDKILLANSIEEAERLLSDLIFTT